MKIQRTVHKTSLVAKKGEANEGSISHVPLHHALNVISTATWNKPSLGCRSSPLVHIIMRLVDFSARRFD